VGHPAHRGLGRREPSDPDGAMLPVLRTMA
jgi:hypothetical protein